jgi:Domain of unknown function (DUF4258)
MPIERFIWTTHAEDRRARRLLDRYALEQAISNGHPERMINRGKADWLVEGLLPDGRHFGVVYDHPHGADHAAARIVTVWDY